jgi:Na+/proline symporter
LLVPEEVLVPTEFVAVIVKVYAVPLESPVTVIGEPLLLALNPPLLAVVVYVVIDAPPLFPGGVKVIVACPFPAVAVPIVGAFGTVAGVTALDALDGVLVPFAFVAVTVKVYAVPFESPVTVIGDDPPLAKNPPVFEVTV